MDSTDLINHVPGVAGGLAASDFVKRLLAPTADLLGQKMKERVERCFQKAVNVNPGLEENFKKIPHRILVPLIQGVALEDDEDLAGMWSALLADSAQSNANHSVNSSFVSILKEMSSDEAKLLKAAQQTRDLDRIGMFVFAEVEHKLGWSIPSVTSRIRFSPRLLVALEGLESKLLMRRVFMSVEHREAPRDAESIPFHYEVTSRGDAFMKACSPLAAKTK